MVGFGIANLIPIVFRAAGALPGVAASEGIAAVGTFGYVGLLAGPPLIGLAADVVTLQAALGLVVLGSPGSHVPRATCVLGDRRAHRQAGDGAPNGRGRVLVAGAQLGSKRFVSPSDATRPRRPIASSRTRPSSSTRSAGVFARKRRPSSRRPITTPRTGPPSRS